MNVFGLDGFDRNPLLGRGLETGLIACTRRKATDPLPPFRVGDSSTNIITPLMPYFPVVVVFCQVKSTGNGTLPALMLRYSLTLLVAWTLLLVGFWVLGIPLGLGASHLVLLDTNSRPVHFNSVGADLFYR